MFPQSQPNRRQTTALLTAVANFITTPAFFDGLPFLYQNQTVQIIAVREENDKEPFQFAVRTLAAVQTLPTRAGMACTALVPVADFLNENPTAAARIAAHIEARELPLTDDECNAFSCILPQPTRKGFSEFSQEEWDFFARFVTLSRSTQARIAAAVYMDVAGKQTA